MHSRICTILLMVLLIASNTSCKKYLETKSDDRLSIPETLEDLEALLKYPLLKTAPQLIFGGSDEYYFEYNDWLAILELHKKGYVWDPELDNGVDWNGQYKSVLYANTVMDNLKKIPSEVESQRWNQVKGTALFYRAMAFYQIAQLYATQYDAASAASDPGIPLRVDADFNKPSTRATVQQTYDQITQDLEEALGLIQSIVPANKTTRINPTQTAAHALLARVYLQMGEYLKAKQRVDACLQLYHQLLDFNHPDIDPASGSPFAAYNEEVIFHTSSESSSCSDPAAKVDSSLYSEYENDDLRKQAFFDMNTDSISYRFKGSYSGNSYDLFNGLSTAEMYLIRAECYARMGNVPAALADLNTLLSKRWKTGTFIPINANSQEDALHKILVERRKELIYRGIRWSDLRRLNKEPGLAVTIRRMLNGQEYTLSPNDKRYVLLIPLAVITTSNLQQNPR